MMKSKKALVTGAGGFIGSHLAEALTKAGHKVRAFIRYNSRNSWGWLEDSKYKKDIEIFCGDIRNSKKAPASRLSHISCYKTQ